MDKENNRDLCEQYMLRCAAGKYFLINNTQNGLDYAAPLVINETGADIWSFYSKTGDVDHTIKKLCQEYKIDEQTASEAVTSFLEEIKSKLST